MSWGKIDDKLHSHWKPRRAGHAALGLWVMALSWCCDHLTDGFFPKEMLRTLDGTPTLARKLVQAGMWHETEGGWIFHDWQEYQPSRSSVMERRAQDAARKAAARAAKAAKRAEREAIDNA